MSEPEFHSRDHPGNRALVTFAQRKMGAQVHIDNVSRDFGRPSIVWRLTGKDGSRCWLKRHENSKLYRRELRGLEEFVPALESEPWWASSRLLAKSDDIEAILVSEVGGEMLDCATISREDEITMYRLAGRFARKLHDLVLPVPETITAEAHLRRGLERYLAIGRHAVDRQTGDWASDMVAQACSCGPVSLVPCHRDYSARNWLIRRDADGIGFGVIDWERADWDYGPSEIQRMVYDHWHDNPALREAYYQGYGKWPTEAELLILDTICLVTAMASIPWAVDHNDSVYADLNRMVIERIKAKTS